MPCSASKVSMLSLLAIPALSLALWMGSAAATPDDLDIAAAPAEQNAVGPGISDEDLKRLLSSSIVARFQPPTAFAFSDDDLKFWASKAVEAHKGANVSVGDPTKKYDVVIQIGHYARKSGRTGGEGRYVTEQQMAALVGVGLIDQLSHLKNGDRTISTLLIGADGYTKNLQSRIFLSLHTDASDRPCSVGPSFGYHTDKDVHGMHAVALALALTLDYDAKKFMEKNYTENLKGYYAYRQFNTQDFKGVLEMSELTCPDQEERLLSRATGLSKNLATALQLALDSRL